MELVELMKQKVSDGEHQINVNSSELKRLDKLVNSGYLTNYDEVMSFNDGTYDVVFYPTERFKEL
ncbi:hypothetical protein BU097_05245 [Staphylococcus xylosus]|uniref:Uncharacterized protein n=1 Tax=Staphylococcus xylosus TaxID=1288 RepID=A0A418IPG8_STAXY|nr:hypothetical protein [Staphylococcus xylosus]RIN11363.1 hypothetical protein BU097_05245 [Staphylococcus xylosus]